MVSPSLFGLGLRHPHYEYILREKPPVGWFEIISENYLSAHRGYWDFLADLRRDYPIVMHGVSLSIGSTDPLDLEYLKKLKALADFLEVPFLSDHLCYTGVSGQNTHDLLPIPYTEEALAHLVPRVLQLQDVLKREFTFENASSYLEFSASTMHEPEFLRELCARTGCRILLDVNNVFVSSFNHGWDAKAYIDAIPAEMIRYFHLAGHRNKTTHRIDTHDEAVAAEVWDLFAYTLRHKGLTHTLIEWDDAIPEFPRLLHELTTAQNVAQHCFGS